MQFSNLKLAWKLFRQRKDGTFGPLFINQRQKLIENKWYEAEDHPTKGYAHRPGWHVCSAKHAPHLTEKGRVWKQVLIKDYTVLPRPASQGGTWFLAKHMTIVKEL